MIPNIGVILLPPIPVACEKKHTMPTHTVLSIDDEQDTEDLLISHYRKKIKQGVYQFLFARNGREGLRLLCEHPEIEVVLADINMPVMDGLTMLEKINSENGAGQQFQFVKTIIITAYADMPNIRKSMNFGAFDFLMKPIELPDLDLTLERALCEASRLRELERQRQRTEKQLAATNFLVDMGGTF